VAASMSKIVTQEGDKLFYPLTRLRQATLIPMGDDLFDVEKSLFRVRFVREAGQITGLRIEKADGNTESYNKEQEPL
jgi:hypothetical protein